MKKLFLIIMAAMFLCSCASIKFNPDTGLISYSRLWNQKITGFILERRSDGSFMVRIDGQQSDTKALEEAIRIIGLLAVPVK